MIILINSQSNATEIIDNIKTKLTFFIPCNLYNNFIINFIKKYSIHIINIKQKPYINAPKLNILPINDPNIA